MAASDDFPLVGFDDLLGPLDEMLSSVEIRRGEPRAPVITDAVFVPAMKVGVFSRYLLCLIPGYSVNT